MQRPPTSRFFAYALILTLVGSLFSLVLPASQLYASHENITVNISGDPVTDTYEGNDLVAIEGIIEDIVEDENVIIRIGEPGDSTPNQVESEDPTSNGNFDYVYDVPGNAEEGVYTVEVEYDGEFAYTYFTVDEENDTILVVLDEETGIYEAGGEVTVSGEVDTPDSSEDFVTIVVLDPANDEIVDEDEVELDGDEFTFDFDAGTGHGRYAVTVTYAFEDQEGSILFEIEDEDGGSGGGAACEGGDSGDDGDLSAEMGADTYAPGDTVCVAGAIESYDDTEELGIVIEDETEEVESDDDVNVEEDGTDGEFTFEYDLENDAAAGTYTVTLTYATDEVELTFEVEEEDGGSGDDDSVTSGITFGDLTAKLNKASYLAGETVTVSGSVDDLKEDEDGNPEEVFILPYMPNGVVLLSASDNVVPSDDGEFSANIVLDSDLDVDDDYWITVTYVDDEVKLFFDITGVSSTPSDEITVETDEDEYSIGSTVEISGTVPAAMIVDGQPLLIRINTPDGNPCRFDQIDVPASGSYTYELVLGGKCGMAGEFEVEATYGDEESKTTFELVGSSASEYTLNIEGDAYPIEYELSGGTINSMSIPKDQDSQLIPKLVIRMNAEDEGQLTLELPRNVIDAIEDGEDIDFVVTIEDESGNIITVDVDESGNDSARTLVIDYPAGTERIEIAGTQVVPEFGAIAAIVMAVAIVGIIAATAKYNKLSFFRQ